MAKYKLNDNIVDSQTVPGAEAETANSEGLAASKAKVLELMTSLDQVYSAEVGRGLVSLSSWDQVRSA
jgi:hypothetical protein